MLTLILPALLRSEHDNIPPLNLPAFNQLRRFATFVPKPRTTTELFYTFMCDQTPLANNQVYASPVVQHTGMNSIQMLDMTAAGVTLTEQQAQDYCAKLNQLYANEAQFDALRPDLWRVTLPNPPTWHAPSIWESVGMLNDQVQAASGDMAQWLQLSTETQMWLHSESAPVNALWIWNAPSITAFESCPVLFSNSAWTAQSSLHTEPLPHDWSAWQRACEELSQPLAQSHWFDDSLLTSAQTGDVWQYHDILHAYEQRFFAPLWQALREGSLHQARMVCEQGEWHWHGKPKTWAFWRKNKPFDGKSV